MKIYNSSICLFLIKLIAEISSCNTVKLNHIKFKGGKTSIDSFLIQKAFKTNKDSLNAKLFVIIDTFQKRDLENINFSIRVLNKSDSAIYLKHLFQTLQILILDSLENNLVKRILSTYFINTKSTFEEINNHISFKVINNGKLEYPILNENYNQIFKINGNSYCDIKVEIKKLALVNKQPEKPLVLKGEYKLDLFMDVYNDKGKSILMHLDPKINLWFE